MLAGASFLLVMLLDPSAGSWADGAYGERSSEARIAAVPRLRRAVFRVTGMTCKRCVARVESALEALDCVDRAHVKLKRERAVVHFDARKCGISDLVGAVRDAGYEAKHIG